MLCPVGALSDRWRKNDPRQGLVITLRIEEECPRFNIDLTGAAAPRVHDIWPGRYHQ